ncbi:DUF3887 domain-containing protein [Curtobacterium sp. NPDC087080]|uniref:DUF3887 domain-containing protein n=1 Tax=Curtobacterium sp. NPDC087080 TaxID=3363965 RepID=UPI003807394B
MQPNLYEQASNVHRAVGDIIASPVLGDGQEPLDTVAAANRVCEQATALLAASVERARNEGVTWQQIGDVLGVSRQAAFQRFGKPVDPATGATLDTAVLPDATELAASVIDLLASGRWDQVTSQFDDAMLRTVTTDGLAAAWTQIIAAAGAFERRGETESVRSAGLTVTNTPLAFEAGDFTARIAFRDDRRISGLLVLAGPAS